VLKYKCLNKQIFELDEYKIIPIRHDDRYDIMKWRNEQMYHLRQTTILTIEYQDLYFEKVVSKLFEKEKPDQVLFSFLEKDKCIGYGGIVHIDWENKNGEISFLISTELESEFFEKFWNSFLQMIEEVAFSVLKFNKIYTYAYDLRPKLYKCLEKAEYKLEKTIEESNSKIIIHSKYNICVQ
jgi:RimJ/RimL family protein N-acetyltransferase